MNKLLTLVSLLALAVISFSTFAKKQIGTFLKAPTYPLKLMNLITLWNSHNLVDYEFQVRVHTPDCTHDEVGYSAVVVESGFVSIVYDGETFNKETSLWQTINGFIQRVDS